MINLTLFLAKRDFSKKSSYKTCHYVFMNFLPKKVNLSNIKYELVNEARKALNHSLGQSDLYIPPFNGRYTQMAYYSICLFDKS
jgi:hypothetical protein